MKLVVVGTGYVGLVSGLCFAEFGFETICVDKDKKRLDILKKGKTPFFEPGLEDLLRKHFKTTKLLKLSSNLSNSMKNADVVFITVGTPTKRLENEADLTAVYKVAKEISKNIEKYCLVVTKSTVPVGTTKKIKDIILQKVHKDNFDVVSNPEFLREGSAINDFMRPDRVVIGTENSKAENIIKEIYRPLYLLETPIISTTIEASEIIKYASNSFLATKIAFINEVADLCEKVGANVQEVAKAMGIDKRIGSKFLHAGPGFGGSCFPKDIKAFSVTGKKYGVNLSIINSVNTSNEKRPVRIASKIIKILKKNSKNHNIGFLGLSFKPNTDDIRDSTSIIILKELVKKNFKVKCFDPKAMKNARKSLTKVIFCKSAYEACKNSTALIIGTEWNDFRALNFNKIKKDMKTPIIFDLRNIYNKEEIEDIGIKYYGIGK